MPHFVTRQFGPIEYQDEAVIEFPHGLPAFEDQTRFLVLEKEGYSPIVFLQSLLRADLCFLTLPVASVDPGYQLSVASEDLAAIAWKGDDPAAQDHNVLRLAILSVSEDRPATANLLAPVLVNLNSRQGVQAVRIDSAYSHQHRVVLPKGQARGEEIPCL